MKHIRDNAETSIRNAIYLKKKSPWKFTDQDHIYGFKKILSLRRAVQLDTQNNCETYLLIRSLCWAAIFDWKPLTFDSENLGVIFWKQLFCRTTTGLKSLNWDPDMIQKCSLDLTGSSLTFVFP